MKPRYRIYQYRDPSAAIKEEEARWVAAFNEQAADEVATRRGWQKEGASAEIFTTSPCVPQDKPGLRQFGCDVITDGGPQDELM